MEPFGSTTPNSDRYVALDAGRKQREKRYISSHYYLLILKQKIMDKKDMKWYEAPEVEIIEAEVEAQLLAGSPIEGVDNPDDLNGGNDDPGF